MSVSSNLNWALKESYGCFSLRSIWRFSPASLSLLLQAADFGTLLCSKTETEETRGKRKRMALAMELTSRPGAAFWQMRSAKFDHISAGPPFAVATAASGRPSCTRSFCYSPSNSVGRAQVFAGSIGGGRRSRFVQQPRWRRNAATTEEIDAEKGLIEEDAIERMEKTLKTFKANFNSVRTGRASPNLLDRVEKLTDDFTRGELSLFSAGPMLIVPAIAESAGYSQASYYTSLGLFIISVPGVWSLIKRSTKSKIVRKTFVVPGPNAENGKAPSLVAGEITSSLARNNFSITDRGEVVTFEGTMVPSRGQAAFLSFCTAISLGCVALVLTITSPEVGSNWYYLTLFSPLAGLYYWTRASRKEEIKVKLVVSDDKTSTDIILQGDDEQIDRLRRELELMEKGMVYVKGIFEQ